MGAGAKVKSLLCLLAMSMGLVIAAGITCAQEVEGANGAEVVSTAPDVSFEDAYEPEGWFENLSIFAGLDGAKQPQDLGINANLGPRVAMNWGLPLLEEEGIGLQLGVGYVAAQNAVAVLEAVDGTTGRDQLFTTLGAFQKLDSGVNWSVAWDTLNQNYYDNFYLSQVRGRLGYQWNEDNELGVWTALHTQDDAGFAGATAVQLRSLSQVSAFCRHRFETGAQTSVWVGAAESHSQVVYVFPGNGTSGMSPVVGAAINVPLNDWASIYGETNLILPGKSGTVDAFLGLSFYPGASAKRSWCNRFSPLLPTAGSPSFSVDMRRL